MCVIMYADKVRPTPEMIDLAFKKNPHGGGVCWREYDDKKKRTLVHWRKGLNVEEMHKYATEMPLPYVLHFRISSNEKPPKLMFCHPFPIQKTVPTWLAGNTGGNVLFHNGHWGDWKKQLLEGAKAFATPLPEGKMSDTRAMAYLCSLYGDQYMELIEEKGISYGPTDAETQFFWGSGWCMIDDVWCSNSAFMSNTFSNDVTGSNVVGYSYGRGTQSGKIQCKEDRCYAYHDNTDGFCAKHTQNKPVLPDIETKKDASGNGTAAPETAEVSVIRSGGTSAVTPFDKLEELKKNLQVGTPGKGKRALKRAMRLYESSLGREARLALGLSKKQQRRQKTDFQSLVKKVSGLMPSEPPMIIKHHVH